MNEQKKETSDLHALLNDLNQVRIEMFRVFCRTSRVPEDQEKINAYVELHDTHQAILAKMARAI